MSNTKTLNHLPIITQKDYEAMYDRALRFISSENLLTEYLEFIDELEY